MLNAMEIKKIRKESLHSVEEFAAGFLVTPFKVMGWENGSLIPSKDDIKLLLEFKRIGEERFKQRPDLYQYFFENKNPGKSHPLFRLLDEERKEKNNKEVRLRYIKKCIVNFNKKRSIIQKVRIKNKLKKFKK